MTKVKQEDTIKVHYTGYLEDGTRFISATDRKLLQFKRGRDQFIPGFEEAIFGIKKCPKKQKDCSNCEILDCPEEEA